jgi:hypothetical protein
MNWMNTIFSIELNENEFLNKLIENDFFKWVEWERWERLFQMIWMRTTFLNELNENDFFSWINWID